MKTLVASDLTPFIVAGFRVESHIPLSSLGTFQIGGPAQCLIRCESPDYLGKLRALCFENTLSAILLGEGSNLLFSDKGWPGLIVRYVSFDALPIPEQDGNWRFNAALDLQVVVKWAIDNGLSGLEAFSGIPGTLGGAVVGNAGAWGVQMEHILESVIGYDQEGERHIRSVADCGFSYRNSALKHEDFWVSEVSLKLASGDTEFLNQEHTRILEMRAARHPDWKAIPCIGSFFKNLEPSSAAERRQAAGFFLEQAGAKELKVGGAAVFQGHANILIKKKSQCTAVDIANLARTLQASVKEMHGIDLIREVRYLGEIEGESSGSGFY